MESMWKMCCAAFTICLIHVRYIEPLFHTVFHHSRHHDQGYTVTHRKRMHTACSHCEYESLTYSSLSSGSSVSMVLELLDEYPFWLLTHWSLELYSVCCFFILKLSLKLLYLSCCTGICNKFC